MFRDFLKEMKSAHLSMLLKGNAAIIRHVKQHDMKTFQLLDTNVLNIEIKAHVRI